MALFPLITLEQLDKSFVAECYRLPNDSKTNEASKYQYSPQLGA